MKIITQTPSPTRTRDEGQERDLPNEMKGIDIVRFSNLEDEER